MPFKIKLFPGVKISDCLEDEDRALINVQSGNAKAKAMESKGCGYWGSLDD